MKYWVRFSAAQRSGAHAQPAAGVLRSLSNVEKLQGLLASATHGLVLDVERAPAPRVAFGEEALHAFRGARGGGQSSPPLLPALAVAIAIGAAALVCPRRRGYEPLATAEAEPASPGPEGLASDAVPLLARAPGDHGAEDAQRELPVAEPASPGGLASGAVPLPARADRAEDAQRELPELDLAGAPPEHAFAPAPPPEHEFTPAQSEAIDVVCAMGFDRSVAHHALESAGWQLEQAMEALMAASEGQSKGFGAGGAVASPSGATPAVTGTMASEGVPSLTHQQEQSVQALCDMMGLQRDPVVGALQRCSWKQEEAMEWLFANPPTAASSAAAPETPAQEPSPPGLSPDQAEKVMNITNMGFEREQALHQLEADDWDQQRAINHLFDGG